MRSDIRRRLDSIVWKQRARIALGIALGLVALGALFTYGYWPDPVVETRIVSGVVTDWTTGWVMGGGARLRMNR